MELLQNHKYKFYELTISYLHEVKTQMESVIELCREGEISVHDVERLISGEFLAAHNILYDLTEKPIEGICRSMSDLAIQQEEINENNIITEAVFDYIAFLEKTEKEELPEILKGDGYQQKRKAKMKTQSNMEHENKESQIMGDQDRKELQKQLNEFINGADTDQEFNNRMNELENMYTPKKEILQKSKKTFYGVLDAFIQGTLTKEKALLLLQSKHQQLSEEIKDMAVKGSFIEIDYEDGKGYMPEEFMKIVDEVNYYYNITKNNIGGNTDLKLENFSSPAVKRVVESVSASFDKYFGITEKKENQPEQETQPIEKTPSISSQNAVSLPLNTVLEKLADQDKPNLRRWRGGKYKCTNLREFINRYADIARENPSKALILDYLIKDKEEPIEEPFRETSIVSTLNLYGISPERKKAKGRQRKGTHK